MISSRTLVRLPFLSSKIRLEALVGDERERMRRVDRLRREDREDLLAEMLVEPALGGAVERLVGAEDMHPGLVEPSLEAGPHLVLAGRPGGRPRR